MKNPAGELQQQESSSRLGISEPVGVSLDVPDARKPESSTMAMHVTSALVLFGAAAASGAVHAPHSARASASRVALTASSTAPAATAVELSNGQLCKLFGRISDKVLLMDESAGACCHSGCDGCPYRYTFDVLEAVAPKWVPTYVVKTIGEREHTPKLISTVWEGKGKVARADFVERLVDASFEQPIGPALPAAERIAVKNDPTLPAEVADALYVALCASASADEIPDALSARRAVKVLREWSEGGDGLMFDEFAAKFRSASEGPTMTA